MVGRFAVTQAAALLRYGISLSTIGCSISTFKVLPIPSNADCGVSYLTAANSSALPLTSSKLSPTLDSDSINFVPPSSAIVPNAVAARFILSCSFVVFLMFCTIALTTSCCVALPSCQALKTSCVLLSKLSNAPSIVPSASLVVTSLSESFTLSRLYAPP